ncbi:PP2C family protein-serine/threonine phosphatase [Actinotalea solisilvae]|uniref:PP2C family protein-serine/threonine phosphatase n=1 Tax=Actinotalea solisilvae TaxID=2072922 RepID=UPI0018F18241|nr:PP2C family serine/threonine-protein phosphatase [Actinotalea solisilvae]
MSAAGPGADPGTAASAEPGAATAEPGAAAEGGIVCPACGSPAPLGARWCEECGGALPAAPAPAPAAVVEASAPTRHVRAGGGSGTPSAPAPCAECGGAIDGDGYCTQCGTKAPRPRDHMVSRPQPWVACVSDRGVRHHRNEDAGVVAADVEPGSWAALVVCDGVSSSQASDEASLGAVRAACDVLVRERGAGLAQGSALTALARARLEAAGKAAAAAVESVTRAHHGDSPPSCTFVAGVVEGDRLTVGNVGDSRAYWLPDGAEPRVLTVDDSWAADQVAAGVPREVAETGPQAHAITRWLGVDAEDQVPTVTHHALDGPGWLLLCSDGLWNYCSEAPATAEQVARAAAAHDGDPLLMAEDLVRWANEQGGKDNITVALARIGRPPARTHEGEPA